MTAADCRDSAASESREHSGREFSEQQAREFSEQQAREFGEQPGEELSERPGEEFPEQPGRPETLRPVLPVSYDAASYDQASWRDSAACRYFDTELFFPIGKAGAVLAETQEAKMVCAGCPVRQACLTFALSTNQIYGIWGGYDEDERRPMHQRWRAERYGDAIPAAM